MDWTIDNERVTQAALNTGAGPLALEEGAELAEYWVGQRVNFDKKIVAVETGFEFWLDEKTAVIGVQDLLTEEEDGSAEDSGRTSYIHSDCTVDNLRDGSGVISSYPGKTIVGNEWKTTKEQTKYWNEERWLESISTGSQVAIYALALQSAVYYDRAGGTYRPNVSKPKIRVKAVSKSVPPKLWPRRDTDGMLTFSVTRLGIMREALCAKAASIRAMRKSGNIPWQVPGIWCVNQFRRTCEYHGECVEGIIPNTELLNFDPDDPASKFDLPVWGKMREDPEIVVLGASAYSAVSECPEKYRRDRIGGNVERSQALDAGSVFHACVGSVYEQIKEQQNV